MVRLAIATFAVLCFSSLAYGQNFTASTPAVNLTAYEQAVSNFSGSVALPPFPCDSTSSGLVGGYQNVDLDTLDNSEVLDDIKYVLSDVFNYFLDATVNLTNCQVAFQPLINISSVCSQVVSGTNYAVEFEAFYTCINVNMTTDYQIESETAVPLRSTVYVPLQAADFSTVVDAYYSPVIRDIWFFDTPEVLVTATPESNPEEASPEEAPAPESSAPGDSGVTLLSPGTGSLTSGTTSVTFSPSASSSPSAQSSPSPAVVSGFGAAAQNQSVIAG